MLHAMRTPPDALPFAVDYMRVIFLAVPFIFLNAFTMMSLRGAGDSKTPLVFSVLAVILDIALNPLLIFGLGPVPAFGIAGSAGSTLIANAVALTACSSRCGSGTTSYGSMAGELSYFRIDVPHSRRAHHQGSPDGSADDRHVRARRL